MRSCRVACGVTRQLQASTSNLMYRIVYTHRDHSHIPLAPGLNVFNVPCPWLPLHPKPYFLCWLRSCYRINGRLYCWKKPLDGIPGPVPVSESDSLSLQFLLPAALSCNMSYSPALLSISSSLSFPAATSSVITTSGKRLARQTAIFAVVMLGIVIRYLVEATDTTLTTYLLFLPSYRRHHLWYHPADLE
jgi:hypothetical protein